MHTIGFISAVLHFSLGVDASPIESSASLASIPLDTSLLQRAGQSLVLTDKVPADKGVTLNRRAGRITVGKGVQQENTSKRMTSLLKDSNGQKRGVKDYIKGKIQGHSKDFSKGFNAIVAKGKEMLSKHTKHSQEQTGRLTKKI
ncbi:hypothetical protein DSO57_1025932 [Entomophthora muscae]|uniref:Uncharacterized protein n=1 Tax=Entomophthora muscae TaxID=34485 RepID=A0ACC2TQ28_9FUNG|nr:hypothetical protein DSO57_1025932 [Entomophthora muscae]